jgi:hypothetical protein
MISMRFRLELISTLRISAVVVAGAMIGGCGIGGDGIELNGGVFDALGVSDKSGGSSNKEPRVAERAGLVLPPTMGRLPTPGASQTEEQASLGGQAWPVSPEQKRLAANQQKEAEHAAWCQKELQRKKINRDLSVTEGPLGPCSPSALTAIGINPNETLRQAQGAGPAGQPK